MTEDVALLIAQPSPATNRVPGAINKALSWVAVAMLAGLIALFVFVAAAPRLLGLELTVFKGGSMEPAIPFNSVALMQDVGPREIKVGDVVRFRSAASGRVVSHRVVAIDREAGTATTKGDRNAVPDETAVPLTAVEARYVTHVPGAGRLVQWVGSGRGYLALIIVPGAMVVLNELWSVAAQLRRDRRKAIVVTEAPTANG